MVHFIFIPHGTSKPICKFWKSDKEMTAFVMLGDVKKMWVLTFAVSEANLASSVADYGCIPAYAQYAHISRFPSKHGRWKET